MSGSGALAAMEAGAGAGAAGAVMEDSQVEDWELHAQRPSRNNISSVQAAKRVRRQ